MNLNLISQKGKVQNTSCAIT